MELNNLTTLLLSLTLTSSIGVSLGNEMEQSPSTLSVQKGNSSVITCTYTDTASDYFPWYKQEPGKGPQLLIAIRSNMGEKKTRDWLFYWMRPPNISPCTSQPSNLETQLSTSVQQGHSASQALTTCTHTCDWSSPPSFGATFKVAFVILCVCKWKLMC